MIYYLLLILSFFYLRKNFKLFWIKRHRKEYEKIVKGAEPFFIKKGNTGILCLHGFTSSAWDYRSFADYFTKKNYTISAPLIAGHGTTAEHLAATTKEDWIDSVEKEYNKLKKECKNIVIAGDSFGGNLALILAAKYKPKAIVVMGAPLFFRHEKLLKMFYLLIRNFKLYKKKWWRYTGLSNSVIKKRMTYGKIPINCIKDVVNVIRDSRKVLGRISAPALIMQSTNDFGVTNNTPKLMFDEIGSKKKKIEWIKDAYHVLIVGNKKQESFNKILDFLKEEKL